MFKLFISIIVVLLALALVACGGEKKAETKTEAESEAQTAVVDSSMTMATCPGCGMTMEKSKMIAHVADDDTLYFCSEGCRDNYLANLPAEEEDSGTE